MSYVFSYKTHFDLEHLNIFSYTVDEIDNVLLLDSQDFNVNNRYCIELQTLTSVWHKEVVPEWDRLKDIIYLLDSRRYKSALILALVIADICSKVVYPTEPNIKTRYIHWMDDFVFKSDIGEHGYARSRFDCVNGYLCYNLRCKLVHGDLFSIEELVNEQESSFIKQNHYKKVFFNFTDKDFSELFVITNDNNEKFALIFHSVTQLIRQIVWAAHVLYEQQENKLAFGDGCDIQILAPFTTL